MSITIPRIEVEESACRSFYRASTSLQERIEYLLDKQRDKPLLPTEENELNVYEELDDYSSLVNQLVRNLCFGNNYE